MMIVLTLHGNKYSSGSLPSINDKIYLDNLQILRLHNLDIYGTISNNIFLSKNISKTDRQLITLYNNRISGKTPQTLFIKIIQDGIIIMHHNHQQHCLPFTCRLTTLSTV